MGRTIDDIMDGAIVRMGDPRAQTPSSTQLLHQVCSQIRTLLRAKRNVSNPWNYGETVVEITPGESTYQITDTAFGTPLAVTTHDPENPNHIVRLIPFSCPQNLNFSWAWPQNAGSYIYPVDGSNCNAARCAIYWQNNLPYIQFLPTPALTPAAYQVKYLANASNVGILALSATPLVDEDCDLVEIRSAISLLGFSEWSSPLTKDGVSANAEKRRNIGATLANDERSAAQQFDIANRITTGPRLSVRWTTTTV